MSIGVKAKLKKFLMIVSGIVVLLIMTVIVTINCAPQFGGSVSKERYGEYSSSDNYKDGKFVNQKSFESHMKFSLSDFIKGLRGLFSPEEGVKPDYDIPVIKIDSIDLAEFNQGTRIIWFGHSSFLIQMDGKNILGDPVFSEKPSPFQWVGTSRFNTELPVEVEKLPKIDAVVISHDHYDHLDFKTIQNLRHKVGRFYTPLGVGVHLEKWGIPKDRIVELDWWENAEHADIVFSCLPAQHFSGRKPNSSNPTLWCSWGIKSGNVNIYFSGDGGYEKHFKEIGEKRGPFDFALLECGQYNEMWPDIHMFPEQTVQAGVDLNAKKVMPIHWGAFQLSQHKWNEPVVRFVEAAKEVNLPVITPKIGEAVVIYDSDSNTDETWWKAI